MTDKKETVSACDTNRLISHNPNAQMVADQAAAINTFQAAKARAASLGHELHQVGNGFMMNRWTHSRHFDDLASVVAMLDQMSARKAGGL